MSGGSSGIGSACGGSGGDGQPTAVSVRALRSSVSLRPCALHGPLSSFLYLCSIVLLLQLCSLTMQLVCAAPSLSASSVSESQTQLPLVLDMDVAAAYDGALLGLSVDPGPGIIGAYVLPQRVQLQPGQSVVPLMLHWHVDPTAPPLSLTVTVTPAALPACPLHDLDRTEAGKAVFAPTVGDEDTTQAVASAFIRRQQNLGFAQSGFMSVSFWAQRTSTAISSGVFSFGSSYSTGGVCWVGWEVDIMLAKCHGQDMGSVGDEDTATGQWSHFVAVWAAGNGDGHVQMFRNGAPGPAVSGATITLQDVGTLMLGCSVNAAQNGPGSCMRGELAEVRIYNRFLSADEILVAASSNYLEPSSLQAWYRFSPPSIATPDPLSTDPCQYQIIPISNVVDEYYYGFDFGTENFFDGRDDTYWHPSSAEFAPPYHFEVQFDPNEWVSRMRYVHVADGVHAAAEVAVHSDVSRAGQYLLAQFQPSTDQADSLVPVFIDFARPIKGGSIWLEITQSTGSPSHITEITLFTRPAQMCDSSGRGHSLMWSVESPAALTTSLGGLRNAVCDLSVLTRITDSGLVGMGMTTMMLPRVPPISYTLSPTHFSASGPTTVRLQLSQPVTRASGGINLELTASDGASVSTPQLQLLSGDTFAEFDFTPAGGQTASQLGVHLVKTQRPSSGGNYFSNGHDCPVVHSFPSVIGKSFSVSAWMYTDFEDPVYFISQGSDDNNGLEWSMGTAAGGIVRFDFWGSNQSHLQAQQRQQRQQHPSQ